MIVGVLISINRGKGIEYSEQVFEVAKKLMVEEKNPYIVGIDFSGHPAASSFADFKDHLFSPAGELGIKLTFHIAEIDGITEETD